MRPARVRWSALGVVFGLGATLGATEASGQVPCAGGTLSITATSDTPFTLPTFNVGQQTTLTATTTGFSASSVAWTIPGPHLKDYNDNLGTQSGTVAPVAWSTTPLTAADLAAPSVTLYWKPSTAQRHPLAGPPESRVVSVVVTAAGGVTCTASTTLTIERNLTDAAKQPEDLYTSTHRAPTTTNPQFGSVIDEHMFWHQFVGGGSDGSWLQFLAWHGYFLRRFDEWRAEFGYDRVAPWYPGRPLPTGPAFEHPASLRLAYNPDDNRIPTWFTIAGGSATRPGGTQKKIGDFTSHNSFSDAFEFSYHGQVHCNIGTSSAMADFFATSGPFFGSMCMASSPKDPMFWRWHGFIDVMYRNHCRIAGITCHSGPDPATDPWMGDNDADIAAGGHVPSPAPRWMSPDIWNRRAPVTTDGCLPRIPPPHLLTVGGVTRDCGSSADHENPVSGTTNFLYATLRNTRPGATVNAYAEVAVYIANASTGLTWPTDFTMLPQSRQFITLSLPPGEATDIGPLPWTPPTPSPSDHFCLYVRVLSVQEPTPTEGAAVDTNVANSNSIAWRNVKVVPPGTRAKSSTFIVRNLRDKPDRLDLQIEVPDAFLANGVVALRLDAALSRAIAAQHVRLEGVERKGRNALVVTASKARVGGFELPPRARGVVRLEVTRPPRDQTAGDIVVSQFGSGALDGGVTLRVGAPQRSP
jgi:hypothetical protein